MFPLICRLCLESTSIRNTFEATELPKRVAELFNIQLAETDELPKQICSNCKNVINSFYEFKENVILSQTKLKEQLQKLKEKNRLKAETLKVEIDSTHNITLDKSRAETTFKEPAIKVPLSDIPPHLQTRNSKYKSDEQIKEFMILECTICEELEQYQSFKHLLDHYRTAHKTKGYVVCCEKKIFRKDRLLDHITNHINPDAFKCPTCGQVSKNKVLLRIHMKQHLPQEERKFKCKHCENKFVLKSQLTNHEASHLKQEEKRFVCDICFKAFALKFVLEKHKLTHRADNRNFFCDICAKSFSTKPNLMAHRANHNDGPGTRVQCKICQQYYKNQDTLRAHLRQHKEQDQEHVCKLCDRRCTTKSSLQAHIKYVHLKIQNYSCDLCDKQFRKKLELKEHISRHTGNSLYQCTVCQKSFKSSSNYFAHRKNKHDLGKTLKSTVVVKGQKDDEQIYDIEIYGEASDNEVADNYVLISNHMDP